MTEKSINYPFCLFSLVALFCSLTAAQQTLPVSNAVPQLVSYSGKLIDADGKPIVGVAGVTFAIYKDHSDSSPLWMETQNVEADAKGNYTVQLGANSSQGLPVELFASGEARWLGVRVSPGGEQARVLLLSVPYALKAADAQTVGGLPASAFVLAAPGANVTGSANSSTSAKSGASPEVGGSGTQNYIPIWTDSLGDLGNSVLYQLGTGSSAKLGINVTNPLLTLDVNGGELVRGLFEMATTGFATATKAYNSQPLNLESSAFNSSTKKYTLNHFQWQAEATGNNTSTPGATLNLLYGTDPAAPTETGLSLNSKGIFTFAPGQTFPGGGTITGVTAGLGLTGGGTSGNVTLSVETTQVPLLNSPNTFTQSQTVNSPNGLYPALKASGTYAGLEGDGLNTGVIANSSSLGFGVGVIGTASGPSGYGVWGNNASTGTGVYGTASGATAAGVSGNNSGGGYGVHGLSGPPSGLTGTPAGVWGDSTNSSPGVNGIGSVAGAVLGTMNNSTPTSWTPSSGVYGSVKFSGGAFSGFGVAGSVVEPSQFATCCYYFNGAAGVWGDSGYDSGSDDNLGGEGVLATSDNNPALVAYNNSPPPLSWPPIYSTNYGGGSLLYLQGKGSCHVDGDANVACSGSNAAVVPVSEDREVSLYAVEAPENWFEDFGSGQLINGAATVSLESTFAQTVNLKLDYHVFLTANGDCKGLYVENKGPSSFEVREVGGGTSNVAFDYRVVAKRQGYESKRLVDVHSTFQKLRAGSEHKTRSAVGASLSNATLANH